VFADDNGHSVELSSGSVKFLVSLFYFCAPCYTKYVVIFIYWIVFCIVGSLRDHGVPSRQPDPKEVLALLRPTRLWAHGNPLHSNSRKFYRDPRELGN